MRHCNFAEAGSPAAWRGRLSGAGLLAPRHERATASAKTLREAARIGISNVLPLDASIPRGADVKIRDVPRPSAVVAAYENWRRMLLHPERNPVKSSPRAIKRPLTPLRCGAIPARRPRLSRAYGRGRYCI